MAPQLAAFICILGILYLFWVDFKKGNGSSNALWIPFAWMFMAGSRYLSQWLNLSTPVTSADAYLDGSPLDRAVFLFLIITGVFILIRRRLNWNELLIRNAWIVLFFLFAGISIIWSDYPYVSFKRLIKTSGIVIMALIIMTEERPFEALGTLFRRLAFLLLPLSVLFIKYYPNLGRGYHVGQPMFTGVAMQKNGLGLICLFVGIYFCWNLLLNYRDRIELSQRLHFSVYLIILPINIWLFYMANSVTSIICMLVVVCLLLLGRIPAFSYEPRRFVIIGLLIISLIGFLELTMDIKNVLLASMGRDADLTTRVPMWDMLLKFDTNPLIGVGYEIFWSGNRLMQIWQEWPGIIQAHNGYIDLYLNLGIVGLFLISGSVIAGLVKVIKQIKYEHPLAMLRISFIASFLLYNWTEAAIKPMSNMFLLLLLGILDLSGQKILNRHLTS